MKINVKKTKWVSAILIILGIIGVALGLMFATVYYIEQFEIVGYHLSQAFVYCGCLMIISGLVLYCLE